MTGSEQSPTAARHLRWNALEWGPSALSRVGRDAAVLALALVVVSAVATAIHFVVLHKLDALGIFWLANVLFNSDGPESIATFAHGKRSISVIVAELRNSIHPYLWLYFAPLIRIAAKIANQLGLAETGELHLRMTLGMYVTLVLSAIQPIVLGFLLHLLGLALRHVILISALSVVAFTNFLFGGVPDHFPITNLAVTGMLVIAVGAQRYPAWDRLRLWLPLGVFATGLNITNPAPLGIAHFWTGVFTQRESWLRRFAKSLALAFSVFLFVLATGHAIGVMIDGPSRPGMLREDFISRFIQRNVTVWQQLDRSATSLANAMAPDWREIRVLPPQPVPKPYDPALRPPFGETSPYPVFTFEARIKGMPSHRLPQPGDGAGESGRNGSPQMSFLGFLALAAGAVGAALMIRQGGAWRCAAAISLSIIAFNLILHAIWGDEMLLYSQHWITPFVLLMGGLLLAPNRWRAVAAGGLALYSVATAWNNWGVIEYVISTAEAARAGALPGLPF